MVETLETVIRFALQIYTFMIFGYILMSWIPQLRDSALGDFLSRVVEPYLRPFKQIIPPIGMLDISPIVALFTLYFAEEGMIYLLYLLLT
ncbi:YggT family protein [Ammoniphilus sp. CFH 90114]|uniref:YggT family protein n=1 Tax=Ammoniphilus sp. CFH 90114 TaxID=2493665 RepID=UPI00100F7987|nr:YggT family protein [Ammoniphilus sp. CFH 90114]RXT15020.1 YggT family protein [Ammoniphilus sp. CFH 90114]